MSYPADVLIPANVEELAEGTLLYAQEAWWLRCSLTGSLGVVPKVLALTGSRAGEMTMFSNLEVLALNSAYGWEIRVEHPLHSDLKSSPLAAVSVGYAGSVGFWGHIYGDESALYCISPHGTEVDSALIPRDAKVRYPSFNVWVTDKKTKQAIGDLPLFSR
ncbi:hypothetical protein [Stenotrophomonas sp.]|uniref:hypothetical protein n=1 Tax=Stenotrophomonas sp. TaxID=69392 RepID=UPI0028AD9176|nr:hypothetical protein [Stenotrophomonas sp.]